MIDDRGTLQLHIDISMSELQRDALLKAIVDFAESKVLAPPKRKVGKLTKSAKERATGGDQPAATVEAVTSLSTTEGA